jgi:hypothetical protein
VSKYRVWSRVAISDLPHVPIEIRQAVSNDFSTVPTIRCQVLYVFLELAMIGGAFFTGM